MNNIKFTGKVTNAHEKFYEVTFELAGKTVFMMMPEGMLRECGTKIPSKVELEVLATKQ